MLDETLQNKIISQNRRFMMGYRADDPYAEEFESDQTLRKPQPPLVKAPMRDSSARIPLPRDFETLDLKHDLISLFRDRKSSRVYTDQPIGLLALSFLLWATQGIKGLRGKSYATLRTVPSGGARHAFETYLTVRNVEGLRPGAYHYLPQEHALEFLQEIPDYAQTVSEALSGQIWGAKGNVVFFWAMDAYRAEWRYGIYAHRVALIDAGHIAQNLYLAAAGLGIGTCGIAALSHENCCKLFELDGEKEFAVYAAPVGTVRPEDQTAEQAFYQFVQDEGL